MKKSYFIIISFFFCFMLVVLGIQNSNAGIYFISKPDNVSTQKNDKPCLLAGYKLTAKDCPTGTKLENLCTQNPAYGRNCSCGKNFQYDSSNCSAPKKLTGASCDGKFETCDCDSSFYKYYTNADCPDGKVIDGTKNSCTYENKKIGYSECSCPSQYSETCSGNLEGVGTACGGKYQSCKCNASFRKCSSNKGDSGSSSCVDSEGTKFTSCQPENCEAGGYLSSIPANNTCTSVAYSGLTCYKDCKKPLTCQEMIANAYPDYKIITGSTISGDLDSGSLYSNKNLVIMKDINGPYTANNSLSYVTIYSPIYFKSQFSECNTDSKIILQSSGKKDLAINNVRFYVPVELASGISMTTEGVNEFNKSVKMDLLTVKSGSTATLKAGSNITKALLKQGSRFDLNGFTHAFDTINLDAVGSDTGRTIINFTNANVTYQGFHTSYFDSLGVDMTLKDTNITSEDFYWQGTYAAGKPDFKLTFDGNSKMTVNWVYARGEGLYVYFTPNAGVSGAKIVSGPSYSFSMTPKNTSIPAYFKSRTGASNSMYQQTNFCSYSVDSVKNFKECTDK